MIVVVGSRHDPAAQRLVAALPAAELCGADDLTRPGWVWPLASPEGRRWVVGGQVVDDSEVSGVFVRRTYVYPQELTGTHGDDREYLAAEATAFLAFVLASSAARVVNPVGDGAIGDDAIRPERWMTVAPEVGLAIRPLRLRHSGSIRPPARTSTVEVVGREAFGATPGLRRRSVALAGALGMPYAAIVFDGQRRLVAVSATKEPSADALPALAGLLTGRR